MSDADLSELSRLRINIARHEYTAIKLRYDKDRLYDAETVTQAYAEGEVNGFIAAQQYQEEGAERYKKTKTHAILSGANAPEGWGEALGVGGDTKREEDGDD
jgi:hypothetical protein